MERFVDSGFASETTDRRSVFGAVMMLRVRVFECL